VHVRDSSDTAVDMPLRAIADAGITVTLLWIKNIRVTWMIMQCCVRVCIASSYDKIANLVRPCLACDPKACDGTVCGDKFLLVLRACFVFPFYLRTYQTSLELVLLC